VGDTCEILADTNTPPSESNQGILSPPSSIHGFVNNRPGCLFG